jgi:hypothetical protein
MLIGVIAHFVFGYYFWGQDGFEYGNDDAFITYRFAQTLVDHGVLSFNADDSPRTEGFSNPLLVASSALAYWIFGLEAVYPIHAAVGALACCYAVMRLMYLVAAHHGRCAGIASAWALSLCPSLWVHATSGLETPLVFLFQILMWGTVLDQDRSPTKSNLWRLAAYSACLVSLRTDGFVFPAISGAWLLTRGQARASLTLAGATAATFLGLMALRLHYFGEPMPNTYYAKISGGLTERFAVAGRLLASIAIKNGLWVGLLAAITATCITARRHHFLLRDTLKSLPFSAFAFAALCAYYFAIGGDIYRERFLLVLFPLGLASAWSALQYVDRTRLTTPIAAIAVLAQMVSIALDKSQEYSQTWPKHDRYVVLGKFLGEQHPGATIAVSAAGKIPYYSRLRCIDMLGLCDPHISRIKAVSSIPGHSKFDAAYTLGRRPDLIATHVFAGGDMTYGLDKASYSASGYRLRYLVRSKRSSTPSIVDVRDLSSADIELMTKSGFHYGVLELAPQPAADRK